MNREFSCILKHVISMKKENIDQGVIHDKYLLSIKATSEYLE